MKTFRLENCEPIFKKRDELLREIDQLKLLLMNLYNIVQNDGSVITSEDLKSFSGELSNFDNMFNNVEDKIDHSFYEIINHIASCVEVDV